MPGKPDAAAGEGSIQPREGEQPVASHSLRWLILLCTCTGLCGQFFAYDIPSVLNEDFKKHLLASTQITEAQYPCYFNVLYSVYSIPNVILPLFLGFAVDKYGYRTLIFLLALSVLCGHFVFSLGFSMSSWPVMLAGRMIFGFGGESVQVAQNALLFRWFRGKEVAFALGLNLAVAGFGSVLNDIVSPVASESWGVNGAVQLGGVFCFIAVVCNLSALALDHFGGSCVGLPEVSSLGAQVSLSNIYHMPKMYWLLALLSVVIYCAIIPFNSIAAAFFVETSFAHETQAVAQLHAGRAMSLLFLVAAIGTPPFGSMVDRIGMRAPLLLFSSVLLTVCYTFISLVHPAVTMFGLGLVFMCFAGALWPSFALAVPQHQLGTAYGVMVTMQNIGLSVVPLFVGYLQALGGKGHFENVIYFFTTLGFGAILLAIAINRNNRTTRGLLNLPTSEVERISQNSEQKPVFKQNWRDSVDRLANV